MTRPSYDYTFPRDPSPAPRVRHPANTYVLPLTSSALIAVGFVVLATSDAVDIRSLSPIRFGVVFVCLLGALSVFGIHVASYILKRHTLWINDQDRTPRGS
jgi:hypothetical protein